MVLNLHAIVENTYGKKSACHWCGTRKSDGFAHVPDMTEDGFLCKRCFLFAEHGPSVLAKLPKLEKDMDPIVALKCMLVTSRQPLTALEFDYWATTKGNRLLEGSKKALQRCIEHKIMAWFQQQEQEEIFLQYCNNRLQEPVDFERLETFAAGSAPSMKANEVGLEAVHKFVCHSGIQATKAYMLSENNNNTNDLFSAPKQDDICNFMIDTISDLVFYETAIGNDDLKDLVVTGRTFDLDDKEGEDGIVH